MSHSSGQHRRAEGELWRLTHERLAELEDDDQNPRPGARKMSKLLEWDSPVWSSSPTKAELKSMGPTGAQKKLRAKLSTAAVALVGLAIAWLQTYFSG